MIHHLSIDIETKSSVDIKKAGAYRYAESEDFEVLLFAYQWDNSPVELVDLTKEELPKALIYALSDTNVIKHADNAAFEWYCLNRAGYQTPIEQWRCTLMHGLYCGYPAGLEAVGAAIGLPQEKKKLTTGRALIKYFCTPCKPTKTNGGRRWNLPQHAPEKWELFKEYCRQDVVTERAILDRLRLFPVPEEEEKLWQKDVLMNACGVNADEKMINGALYIDEICSRELTEEAAALTGLANPNSTAQLLPWLSSQLGKESPNLQNRALFLQIRNKPGAQNV